MALTLLGSSKAQETQVIGKSNIKLSSKLMTPEAMWAMGRIGSCQASPDGKHIIYQVSFIRWAITASSRTRATKCST